MCRSGGDQSSPTASESESNRQLGSENQQYADQEFIDYLETLEYPPVAGTTEVADAVGCTPDTAFKRLSNLRDLDIVGSKSLGHDIAWYLKVDDID